MPNRVQVKKSLLTTYYQFLEFIKAERVFLIIIALCFFAAGSSFQYAHIAMWLGFMFAAYSAVANDSIQTIGTFLSSNSHQKWYVLWLFIGGIFLITVTYSWFIYSHSGPCRSANGVYLSADCSTHFSADHHPA
jgi:hypothetical protein